MKDYNTRNGVTSATMLTSTPQKPRDFQSRIYRSNISEINEALKRLLSNGTAKFSRDGYIINGVL